MRRGAAKKPSQRGNDVNATSSSQSMETSALKPLQEARKPFKGARGRGLGKAGARRLGRMIIQAMQPWEEPKRKGKVSLPKTPIGLLEYHFQKETNYVCETDSPTSPSPQVSRFIGQVVSKYKCDDGLSMAELKQMLAAEGYDVNKNNRQVNVATKRLTNDETLVRTTRSKACRLNNKVETSRVNANAVKFAKPKEEVKQNIITFKVPKGAESSQRSGKNSATPKAKSPKSKSRPKRAPAKSHNQTSKTRKSAGRFHEQKRETPRSKKKALMPAGKKGRSAKNQVQKSSNKTKKTVRCQTKQVQHLYKTQKREPPRRKGSRTGLRSQRQHARRAY